MINTEIIVPNGKYHNVKIGDISINSHPQLKPKAMPIIADSHNKPRNINRGPSEKGFKPKAEINLLHGPDSGGPKYLPLIIT